MTLYKLNPKVLVIVEAYKADDGCVGDVALMHIEIDGFVTDDLDTLLKYLLRISGEPSDASFAGVILNCCEEPGRIDVQVFKRAPTSRRALTQVQQAKMDERNQKYFLHTSSFNVKVSEDHGLTWEAEVALVHPQFKDGYYVSQQTS